MRKLKIFYFRHSLPKKTNPTPLLFPFLGPTLKGTTPFVSAVFNKINYDRHYLSLVANIKEADCLLLPKNYWMAKKYHPGLVENYIHQAKLFKKPLLIDAYGDSTQSIDIPNTIILRTSLYRETKKPNEIVIPAYTQDLLKDYCNGRLKFKKWQPIPTVGFVGWGKAQWRTNPKIWLKQKLVSLEPSTEGLILRQKFLETLENESGLKTNFIYRDNYSGHTHTLKGEISKLRQAFVDNILANDYTVCVRGAGNYSYRFYETLSLGRTPIILDTDVVLPLENKINYHDFCLFLKISQIDEAGKILAAFHQSLSPKKFLKMQQQARQAFAQKLRLDSFTKYLVSQIVETVDIKYKKPPAC